ncbi:MAG: hypothetical protein JWO30_4148 [Fibrobacteres bacterium]|nr:hypothetical protein [Fibrobacterota bacterium]
MIRANISAALPARSAAFPTILCLAFSAAFLAAPAGAQTPWPQDTKNPSLVIDAIPLPATYMNMGMAFLSDGRMVMATTAAETVNGEIPPADANSFVAIVSGVTGDMSGISVKKISNMWKQPSGITIVDDKVYAAERDGFYQIQNLDNPANLGANRTKIIGWPQPDAGLKWTNGEQWHQWVMTPAYVDGKFYGPYGGSTQPGGRSLTPPTSSYSGAFLSWAPDGSGGLTKVAGGLRQPNGMTTTPSGQMFVTDNQGGWLPACSFQLIKPGKNYGYRQGPPNTPNWAESLPYEPPVAWLVDGVHQSASQPLYLDKGPYAGDFLIGDVNSPGLSRVALDKVGEGTYNGALFFFTGGFGTAAVNRLALQPKEDAIIVGTFLAMGDWPAGGTKPMYRIKYAAANTTFEMREIHSRQGGVEIVFSQPVDPATAVAGNFTLSQWHYNRTVEYGCCIDGQGNNPSVASVKVSDDHKRVFIASTGATASLDRELKILTNGIKSATGASLFYATAYFTHNYQSQVPFSTATVAIADRNGPAASSNAMDLSIHQTVLPGRLRVQVSLSGNYSVSLHALNGARLDERRGTGPAEFNFSATPGAKSVRMLQVKQAGRSYVRRIFF